MRNAGTRRVKVDPVLGGERFDLGVLLQVLWGNVLDVVIDREHRLRRIGDRRGADLLEFWNHRAGVVMRQHMARTNRNKISGAHYGARSESVSMTCGNFFDERQIHISLLLE